MKKLLVGLMVLSSVSSFAGGTEVVCSMGNTSDIKAEIHELNILISLRKNVKQVTEVRAVELRDGNTMACVSLISNGMTKK